MVRNNGSKSPTVWEELLQASSDVIYQTPSQSWALGKGFIKIIRDKQLLMFHQPYFAEQNSTAEFVLGIRFVNLQETIATNAHMLRTMSLSDTTAH